MPGSPAPQGTYLRQTQDWAVAQEIYRHDQALYMVGEYAMYVLLWTASDYAAGLVGLCLTCASDPISKAYGQPTRNKCPDCYGTRFEGGYRALIVRPSLFIDGDDGQNFSARGVVAPQGGIMIETTTDFRVHSGDYCLRATGERFQLSAPKRATVRTGFATVHQATAGFAYNVMDAAVEDETSVAYMIPPAITPLITILSRTGNIPQAFSDVEVLRAPLIPLHERD
jgi:hypothetical protein